jgi:alpha-L-fucosidase
VREACDRHGLKLALYFSAGDWSVSKGAENARINREQLKELCTKYGPIEFFWLDICGGIGGSPEEIAGWIKEYQPGCLVGFNGGKGGDMRVGESYRFLNKDGGDSKAYDDYPVREFAKQIVGANPGGGNWFYNKKAPMTPEQILKYYEIAEREQVLLSLDVGPGPDGKLRPQDVKALEGVGQLLRLRKTSN